jgi:glutamate-ammonia-ligase adenylyltransferase
VEALAQRLCDLLKNGRADPSVLQRAGSTDPARDQADLLRAAEDPDLRPALEFWAPALLRSARPGFGAQSLVELARARRESGGAPLDATQIALAALLLGSSNFIIRLLRRHPDWVDDLREAAPPPPSPEAVTPDWDAIRRAKYRGLLRIAARDLAGRPFDDSLRELSDLADRCLVAALETAAAETAAPVPALLALGKLGGRELNFSSDVDLLFLYHVPPGRDSPEHNHAVARLVRHLKTHLEEPTGEGFGYRVDLDLRPEGRTGVVANSVDAALVYYESFGAEWERQMLIRLRPVAGPVEVSDAFASAITPFVYRRLIDPGVMHNVRDMKARIEDERRRAGRDLEASLKEGPGGIRDVEFLVQSLQLFHGGRQPELRSGNVLDTLSTLGRLQLLPEPATAALREGYIWLRRAEHAVQLVEEQQTCRFPRDPVEQMALARRMGYANAEGAAARAQLLDDWVSVRAQVRGHFEALVLAEPT